jgi:mercuric ion binding protein
MKHLSRIAVVGIALGAGGLAALTFASTGSGPSARSGEPAQIQVAASERIQSFAIENMYCASCPFIVRRAIESVAGVRSVRVDFAEKTATVVYDPSVTTVDTIADAPARSGYPTRPIGS